MVEMIGVVLLAILLVVWIALGQERYRKWAGKGRWGHVVLVVIATLMLMVLYGLAGDPHVRNPTMFIWKGVGVYAAFVTVVVVHGFAAARRRRRRREGKRAGELKSHEHAFDAGWWGDAAVEVGGTLEKNDPSRVKNMAPGAGLGGHAHWPAPTRWAGVGEGVIEVPACWRYLPVQEMR
jgi:hypothetical protein